MSEPHYRYLRLAVQDGVLVLAVTAPQLRSGDFDLIDQVRQELLASVALNGTRKVVIDLGQVEYIGSGGFRPLLSLRKKLQETGGDMVLCGLRPDVHEVFLTSRLIDARGSSSAPFGVEADAQAAVARLAQAGDWAEVGDPEPAGSPSLQRADFPTAQPAHVPRLRTWA